MDSLVREQEERVGDGEEEVNEGNKVELEEGELLGDDDIVGSVSDGGHEAHAKAVGGDVVERTSDGEHFVEVGEEEVMVGTVGDAIFEKNKEEELLDNEGDGGEQKAEVGGEEVLDDKQDDVVFEESVSCEQQTQGLEEPLNGTVSNVIVEQSTDGEHKALVGEEEDLEEIAGDFVVKENSDGNYKAQGGEGELLNVEMDNVVLNFDGENDAKVEEEEPKGKLCNVGIEQSTVGEPQALVKEGDLFNKTMDDIIIEEGINDEQRAQDHKEDALIEPICDAHVSEGTYIKSKWQGLGEPISGTMGDVITQAGSDGELKAQVVEEAMAGTTGNVIVQESIIGEPKVHAWEEESTGSVTVQDTADGEHKAEGREDKDLSENTDNAFFEESADGNHKVSFGEKTLAVTMDNAFDGESMNNNGGKAPVMVHVAFDSVLGNFLIEESTIGEHTVQFSEQEVPPETVKQKTPSLASPTEKDQLVSYNLPSLEKAHFSISDLVWGKVKSHPWWPGQIFDPSDASKLAMNYMKMDSYLVAYFGDKTFAWCDESQLKPFHSYFSQFEKQCSSDTFVKAIHDIMMEVSRRVELGMACSCLPTENYTNIMYQKVENAGIRGGYIDSIIDRPALANYFQPDKLLEYISSLSQFPNGRVDKLEFMIAQSQLKAFYSSKGYRELPMYTVCRGLMDSAPENSPSTGKVPNEDMVDHSTTVSSNSISVIGKLRGEESSFNKQIFMTNLSVDGTPYHLANGGKSTFVAKSDEKPISSFSGKKHVIVESDLVDSGRYKKRMLDSFEDMELKSPSPSITGSFKIGEFIRRAANQLTVAPPIVKCQGETLQKFSPQIEEYKDDINEFDVPSDSPIEYQRIDLSFREDYDCTDELFSQLCLAAADPMGEYTFVPTVVAFFTDFKSFSASSSYEDKEYAEKRKRGRPKKLNSQQAFSDISHSEDEKYVEKRKRGRPRKVIYQQAASDVSSSGDEQHVEKRKRDILKNVISQLAASDVSSEDEKPVEKRKRGRPRKNPLPAPSESSAPKHISGKPRGRPKKVNSQLGSPDYNSSNIKKPGEVRKRGRPRKVDSVVGPSDMSVVDHMKDTYWSDVDLQTKMNDRTYQSKRRKSTGEQSPLLPSALMSYFEEQLQLVPIDFVAERTIISIEEKIVKERIPTSLNLSFSSAHSLPSETDLIRIFSRYGPLKEEETYVSRNTNCAKLVFKRRADAETAFSSAGKYRIFGRGLLSYQLKPWTPTPTTQATPQDTHDATPDASRHDGYDAEPISTQEDNHDLVPSATPADFHETSSITAPQDNHDPTLTAIPQDNHDVAPIVGEQGHHDSDITMVQEYHSEAAVSSLQDKGNAEVTLRSHLELSEKSEEVVRSAIIKVEDRGSSPFDKHDSGLMTTQQESQVAVPVVTPLDEQDISSITQDNLNATPIGLGKGNHDAEAIITLQDTDIITPQEICDASPAIVSNMEISEQAEGVMALDSISVESESKESTHNNRYDPAQNPRHENLVILSMEDQDLTVTRTQDNIDTPPNTMMPDNHDAPAVFLQDQCDAGLILRSNVEISVQAEDAIEPDNIQVVADGKDSSMHQHNPAPITASQEINDAVATVSPLDEQDLTPTSTQDKMDVTFIKMVEDYDATVPVTCPESGDAVSTAGSNSEPSDQAKNVIASEMPTKEVHDSHDATPMITQQDTFHATTNEGGNLEFSGQAEGKKLPEDNFDPAMITALHQKEEEPSLLDKHDSILTTTEDQITKVSDYHDAATSNVPHDEYDPAFNKSEQTDFRVASESVQVDTEGCNPAVSEGVGTETVSDAMNIQDEGKDSSD